MRKVNRHRGTRLELLLQEDGLNDDVQAAALKRALAETIAERMASASLTKVEMARRMRTSRSQLDRVLDPAYTAVQFDTLVRAAGALGLELRITMR
jgi:antitoxin HicB